MLLAVAGQSPEQIRERTRKLSEGEWSQFSPADQVAFAFVRKHALAPSSIADGDIGLLIEHFGAPRAADVIWWSSRCHFMTRVADAFQLPLEKDNVFQAPPMPKPAP